jgi:hypothetical protein
MNGCCIGGLQPQQAHGELGPSDLIYSATHIHTTIWCCMLMMYKNINRNESILSMVTMRALCCHGRLASCQWDLGQEQQVHLPRHPKLQSSTIPCAEACLRMALLLLHSCCCCCCCPTFFGCCALCQWLLARWLQHSHAPSMKVQLRSCKCPVFCKQGLDNSRLISKHGYGPQHMSPCRWCTLPAPPPQANP